MDIFTLNSSFEPDKLIEGWNGLAWSERFSVNGDFQIESNDVDKMLTLLPVTDDPSVPPTTIGLEGSDVPMIVEDHEIIKPKHGPVKVITTGRSFETVLDRRQTITTVTSGVPLVPLVLEKTSVVNLVHDLVRDIVTLGNPTSADIIPEIAIVKHVYPSGPIQKYSIEPKDLYTWAIETLTYGPYGLKAVRGLDGIVYIAIYDGYDRTNTTVFDVSMDQFDEAKYVLSNRGSKNTMITSTKNGQEFSSFGSPAPSGINRRVDYQDLSSEITLSAGSDLTNLTINRGKVALATRGPIALFSGSISETVGSGYGVDYGLGDLVTLQGDYGLSQKARVAEFIRTQDNTGTKAYPTFEAVAT